MAKIRRVPVRSFGSETPEPTVPELAGWVKGRRGLAGDLTTYLLGKSLDPSGRCGYALRRRAHLPGPDP